jgi:hypothetical protein
LAVRTIPNKKVEYHAAAGESCLSRTFYDAYQLLSAR